MWGNYFEWYKKIYAKAADFLFASDKELKSSSVAEVVTV